MPTAISPGHTNMGGFENAGRFLGESYVHQFNWSFALEWFTLFKSSKCFILGVNWCAYLQKWILSIVLSSEIVLIVYDILLTFSQEVHCIWRWKFSAITILYVAVRYGGFLQVILQLLSQALYHDPHSVCDNCLSMTRISSNSHSDVCPFPLHLFLYLTRN